MDELATIKLKIQAIKDKRQARDTPSSIDQCKLTLIKLQVLDLTEDNHDIVTFKKKLRMLKCLCLLKVASKLSLEEEILSGYTGAAPIREQFDRDIALDPKYRGLNWDKKKKKWGVVTSHISVLDPPHRATPNPIRTSGTQITSGTAKKKIAAARARDQALNRRRSAIRAAAKATKRASRKADKGIFDDEIAAARAYDAFVVANKHTFAYKSGSNLNFPGDAVDLTLEMRGPGSRLVEEVSTIVLKKYPTMLEDFGPISAIIEARIVAGCVAPGGPGGAAATAAIAHFTSSMKMMQRRKLSMRLYAWLERLKTMNVYEIWCSAMAIELGDDEIGADGRALPHK